MFDAVAPIRANSKTTLSIVAVFGVLVALSWLFIRPTEELAWTMINVNQQKLQGDAHLIQVQHGRTVLIDAGYLQPARNALVPYLRGAGISSLDLVFISHPHRDHYEGLRALIEADITLEKVFVTVPDREICDKEIPWGCNYDHLVSYIDMLKQQGVEVSEATSGSVFDLGHGVTITTLYAFDGVNTPVGRTDINDMSLIMMLEYASHRFLFTGDLNQPIGNYLATYGEGLTADVLKVPHHGIPAIAPDSFFEKVNPKYALVPAPASLWCAERSAAVRTWFQDNEIPVFVNGLAGHITVMVTQDNLTIATERSQPAQCD